MAPRVSESSGLQSPRKSNLTASRSMTILVSASVIGASVVSTFAKSSSSACRLSRWDSLGQRLGRRVGGNRHPQYRDDLVGRRAQAIAILPLSEMFERLCKTDHSETEPGFIVLRVGGDARRQVGLAGLEMAALQGLPRDIRGDSREGGTGRQPGQSQRQREPTWHGSIPL